MCMQPVGESGPLCGQSEHPPVEGLYPQKTVRHTGGQVVQSVAPVPCREALEILPEGMVFPYIGGVHHACHVAVPTVDAVAVCFEADGIQVSFRGGPEGPVFLISQTAEFRGFGKNVEAELVSFGEETAEGRLEVGGFLGRRFALNSLCFRRPEDVWRVLRNGCGPRRSGSGFGRVGFGCGYSGCRLRRNIAGHVLRPSCHTFFVPPSYGGACNLFEVHRLCVFGVFSFANIRHEKAFVKPFTVTY
ncbi:conserved domain protein [Paraprevotella clara CAG:116]|nr:conserved domain protein [Paraprevotella clara CAG:116]